MREKSDNPMFSVVIPVYSCAGCLQLLYKRLVQTLEQITSAFEIIMINDSSPDNSWQTITALNQADPRVVGIYLSRNFGQHNAISAGLDHCTGDWVVVMDCDLQDLPEEIPHLYTKALEGFDVVFASRSERKDKMSTRVSSMMFWKTYDYFTNGASDPSIGNFSIISRKVVANIKRLSDQDRSYPLLIRWLGFPTTSISVTHASRAQGCSSYTLRRKISLAVNSIAAYSNKPLRMSIKLGLFMALLSGLYATKLVIGHLFYQSYVPGWTSVMVSIYFTSGLTMAVLGIQGVYIGKIFTETKVRPKYIINKTVGIVNE